MYNPYQQQQGGFNTQQNTGFGNGVGNQFGQPQMTGFYSPNPQSGIQSQATGLYGGQQTGFIGQQGMQYNPTGISQPANQMNQTGYIQTQPTGFSAAGASNAPVVQENATLKIPSIRLSFITASDQNKFEHLFRTAVPPGEQAIGGDSARDILLRSGLSPITLAEIWSLSDTNKSGSLLFPEFALSLHLCNLALKGDALPARLPEKWVNEVRSFVDAINFSVPEDPSKILADTPFAPPASNPTGNINNWYNNEPQGSSNMPITSFQSQPTGGFTSGLTSQRTGGGSLVPLNPQQTSSFIPAQKTGSLGTNVGELGQMSAQRTGYQPSLNPQSTGFQQLNSQAAGLRPQLTGYTPQSQSLSGQMTGAQQPNMGLQAQNTGFGQQGMRPQTTGIQPQLTGIRPQTTGFQSQSQTTGLQPQTTGFRPQVTGLQAQTTGFQPQSTGFQPQATGFQPQATGFQPQATGFQPQATGFQPQATGFQPQETGIQRQATGLQPQLTGKPGQWGFISTPTGGIPGLNAMEQHFLPSSQLSSNNLQNAMGGSLKENVTWAITKQEKQIYDGVFSAWDPQRKGFINGDVAVGIFGKSGLNRTDLESIWNLVDSANRGKLNKDEFAVAMHLVYRRLNGYEIPLRLPPELVPPSAKYIQDSMDSLKSTLKNSSSKPQPKYQSSKLDGKRFKNDDSDVAYTSSVRHKRKDQSDPQQDRFSSKDSNLKIEDLKKAIKEKRILLETLDAEDQDANIRYRQDETRYRGDIDSLKAKIRNVHSLLLQKTSGAASVEERKALLSRLDHLTRDTMPSLISRFNQVNQEIARSKTILHKLRLQKENPNWHPDSSESEIVGTGVNGEVTEADRKKFRSKQLLKQRMAALTGKSQSDGNQRDLDLRLQQEEEKAKQESKNQSSIIQDIETSIKDLEEGCAVFLQVTNRDDIGARKWERGEDVPSEVKEFIYELQKDTHKPTSSVPRGAPETSNIPKESKQGHGYSTPLSSQSSGQSNHSPAYGNAEERANYIKAQAERKMNERLAKLGIRRSRAPASTDSDHEGSQQSHAKNESSSKDTSQPPIEKAPQLQTPSVPYEQTTQQPSSEPEANVTESTKSDNEAKPPGPDESSDDEDEEDEEYQRLLKEKQEMERRRKEQKEKKKKEKEERLLKLRKEMASLKEAGDDSEDEEEPKTEVPTYGPTSAQPKTANPSSEVSSESVNNDAKQKLEQEPQVSKPSDSFSDQQKKEPAIQPVANNGNGAGKPHDNNPFAKNLAGNQNASPHDTNPFFASANKDSGIDPAKAAAQRNSQRGISDANDWSDDEQASSDDDIPNRAGAAQLANLLFGGAAQPPKSEGNTYLDKDDSNTVIEKESSAKEANGGDSELDVSQSRSSATKLPEETADDSGPTSNKPETESDSSSFISLSDRSDDFEPPSGPVDVQSPPPLPEQQAPPAPPPLPEQQAPPAPPPLPEQMAPPAPPPLPEQSAPPAPPPLPESQAPLPPPLSGVAPPPPPPDFSTDGSNGSANGGSPNIGALLGEIRSGQSLKKVDKSQQRIGTGATVGRVL
ncbi:Piso0_001753 [Millerozyma farinosa CBS 7064]|uniref:Actin cytoskeleton-regulatory complex protein PAN1 n=1 Tax=Pichia sorbitophila (strain ATCC MYA-4447 / BCRC 22081 / CBS 7064 / NBRC 10061 / NRRL Y-12695) TaxID=559304 RepID=G8YP03_PICSO|nr:Piso0_001753 [Millerozyma farinosa CBS 7064]